MRGTSDPGGSSEPSSPRTGHIDRSGRYHDRGKWSAWNIGAYLFLIGIILIIFRTATAQVWVPYALIALVLLLTARYLSTRYVIDDTYLYARRFLGGQRMRLEDIREIDYQSLRNLSPVGVFGSWGWRGRMWSTRIGTFDAIYTDTFGLLVVPNGVSLFISPENPAEFARELSRRVRSFTGPLKVDVGDPAFQSAAPVSSF